jgi:cyclopropane-fatty-acyl-phospholipid synthase
VSGSRRVATTVRAVLARIAGGRLRALPFDLRFWDGSTLPARGERIGTLRVNGPEALAYVLHEPNQLGLARAWVAGALEFDGDLEALLRARHRLEGVRFRRRDLALAGAATAMAGGPAVLRPPPIPDLEARMTGVRHSLARDRQAVRHHYDVSNDFYRLVLGPTLVYSCAYFTPDDDSLDAAQERKLELICRKLRLSPSDRLLDVGCGWGSLVIHAAARHGVRAVGVTLSGPQAELARARIREAGVADRCEVRVADYREVADGPYDKIASVGMYEHVGLAELGTYAEAVAGLLRPGGLFLNHGIVRLFSDDENQKTFVRRYIFPDGELHPVTAVMEAMRSAGLEVRDVESLREHYTRTLRAWVRNLEAHRNEAIALVGADRERVWRLYMTGSALGFEDADISVFQVLAAHRGADHGLPLDRRELIGSEALV